jgi:hypothetical protein
MYRQTPSTNTYRPGVSGLCLTVLLLSHSLWSLADQKIVSLRPFHSQFIPQETTPAWYKPTIKITVSNIHDADQQELGWYSDENPNTRFNQLWLNESQPGYRSVEGSKVLNRMLQFSFKKAYKKYRSENVDMFKQLPNEEGNGRMKNWDAEMEYTIRASDDSIKMGMEYKY